MPRKEPKQRVNETCDDLPIQAGRHNELILSAVGEGIYGISREGLTTFVNPAATAMTGWLEADLLGKGNLAFGRLARLALLLEP